MNDDLLLDCCTLESYSFFFGGRRIQTVFKIKHYLFPSTAILNSFATQHGTICFAISTVPVPDSTVPDSKVAGI